ncbi:MAG: hypothetical protein Q4G71_01765 [Pseudomonadota bacterium]|nr:hypothetical protein [Pseudomonadota bacterium]
MNFLAVASTAAVLGLSMNAAQAQSSTAKPSTAKPAAQKPAPKAAANTRKPAANANSKATAQRKPATSKGVPARTARAVEAATPVETLTQRLSDAEQAIARNVHTGAIQCELGQNVTVTPDAKNPGFFHITAGKQRYYMHPVESRTGALRLEDNRAGAMWLQLGNKSMLLNQKLGQRVADECAAPQQREFAAQLKNNPQPDLLGGPAK